MQNEPVNLDRVMNISILNALWVILVGEKLDLDDPKLVLIIKLFDNLNRTSAGPTSPVAAILPHPSMSKWPVLRELTGFQAIYDSFNGPKDFIEPYIKQHQASLDPDNIRDFVDLMLVEIQNTTDPTSSFYGEVGALLKKFNFFFFFFVG